MVPIFVFDDPPTLLVVYESLDDARGMMESLDVAGNRAAFTAAGQVIEVTAGEDLFSHLELTDRYDLSRLRSMLREARGPSHLAGDPMSYDEEWLRLDEIDARWSPIVPGFVRRWLDRRQTSTAEAESHE